MPAKKTADGSAPELEKVIQSKIMTELGSEPDFLLMRNSVGVLHALRKNGDLAQIRQGLGKGSPDLVGILRAPDGRGCWLAWEVKRPGEEPREDQIHCHKIWRNFGAIVDVVTSVDEAKASLKRAREMLSVVCG